jgi:hypothetical protein
MSPSCPGKSENRENLPTRKKTEKKWIIYNNPAKIKKCRPTGK